MTNSQKQEPKGDEQEATDLGSRASGESRAEGWGGKDGPCETPRRAKAVHASLAVGDKATLGSCPWGATGQGPGDTPQKGRRPSNSGAQMATAGLSRDSPGQNTGVGSLSLLQGIFPTQGSNGGLPHCRRILYQLSYQESFMRFRYGVLRKFKTQLSGRIDLLISKKVFPTPGIERGSRTWQVDSLPAEPQSHGPNFTHKVGKKLNCGNLIKENFFTVLPLQSQGEKIKQALLNTSNRPLQSTSRNTQSKGESFSHCRGYFQCLVLTTSLFYSKARVLPTPR